MDRIILFVMFSCFPTEALVNDIWENPYAEDMDWGGICQTGLMQSPINIFLSSVYHDRTRDIIFSQSYSLPATFSSKKNNHTLVLEPIESKLFISETEFNSLYKLKEIHFHWPSEHAIDGERSSAEAHFVHVKNSLDYSEALNLKDSIIVFGVLIEAGFKSTTEFGDLIRNALAQNSSTKSVVLKNVLPDNLKSYVTYKGSLTTPKCNEVVVWIIFMDKVFVHADIIKTLKKQFLDEKNCGNNNRPFQDVNGREIYLVNGAPAQKANLLKAVYVPVVFFKILFFMNNKAV